MRRTGLYLLCSPKNTLALALAVACGLAPLAGLGQQPADLTRQDAVLPEVVSTSQHEAQVVRKTADLQKIVISEEEVDRYGDATVGDVLRRLPGMTFTGPAGVTKDIRMRGLDKGYTQFLINGEPVAGALQERQMQVDRLPART
jgi:outer membrane receptor for ferrienterochelin and colicins